MVQVDWLPEWLSYALYLIWLDQTLIAGTLAALGAAATVIYLHKQIAQTDIHHRDEHVRKHRMLRAGLPAALAELSKYAEDCGRLVWEHRHSASASGTTIPDVPGEALRNIQAAVATADEPAVSDLEKLIRFFQIQTSRLDRIASGATLTSHESADRFRDAVFLKAATNRLFSYARGDAEVPDAWNDSSWAKNQIPTIALKKGSGSLPIDVELEEQLERHWDGMIKRYG